MEKKRKSAVKSSGYLVMVVITAMNSADEKTCVQPFNCKSMFFSNEEEARNEAIASMHRLCCDATGDEIEQEKFLEDPGKYVELIEDGGVPGMGEEIGFVHCKSEGMEHWQGFDTSGECPCVVADILVVKRDIWTDGKNEIRFDEFVSEAVLKERQAADEERHKSNQECLDSISRTLEIENNLASDEKSEYDRIMSVMGEAVK